jgi:hypothetical protein
LAHPFEELGDLRGIRFVADTTTTSPDGSAGFFNHRWPIRVYLQSKLWARDGRLRFIQTICHEFWKYSGKCIAGLATALGRVHRRGLIHKELAKTRTAKAPFGARWAKVIGVFGSGGLNRSSSLKENLIKRMGLPD